MPKKAKLAAVAPALPALSPVRAALLEHRAALAAAETQHQTAANHVAKLRELIQGPAETEQEIRARIATDAAALQEWIRSGAVETKGRPAFEWAGREELEDRLVAQRHAAEIATAAMADAEAEVERMAGVVAELRGKIADAERAAVLEVADEIGRHYLGLIDKAVTALTTLKGLDLYLGRTSLSGGINLIRTDLSYPLASLPCMPTHGYADNGLVEVNDAAAAHLVSRWAELAKVLADDPTAAPKAVFDWEKIYVPLTL